MHILLSDYRLARYGLRGARRVLYLSGMRPSVGICGLVDMSVTQNSARFKSYLAPIRTLCQIHRLVQYSADATLKAYTYLSRECLT